MNKPSKPRRPSRPKKPSETTSSDVKFTFYDVSSVEGKTLQELVEIACEAWEISIDEVDVSRIRICDITIDCSCGDCYGGNDFEMSISINPRYLKQMTGYNKNIVAYEKKYATYTKNLSKYEEDLKKYEEDLKRKLRLRRSLTF